MSRLVPEKRVDKNGVLTTKYVKASSEKDAFKGSVPAPVLGEKTAPQRKLTKGQTSSKRRGLLTSKYPVDHRIHEALGTNDLDAWVELDASDEGMYSVLGVTSPGDGIALIHAGYQTADAAKRFLKDVGLDDLIEDHTKLCDEALERRISPESYLEAVDYFPYLGETNNHMDAMEAFSHASIRDTSIYSDVYHGEIRLADVKAIGVTRIAKARTSNVIRESLKKLVSGGSTYTIDDLKMLIDKHPNHVLNLHHSLELTDRYGVEFALSLNAPDPLMSDYLEGRGEERKRILDIVRYDDQIRYYRRENLIYTDPLEHGYIVQAFDANLGASGVAEGRYSMQQLEAIIEGMEKSVSGGWL